MTLTVEKTVRTFLYNGIKLADPDPAESPLKVRDFYANLYPEIVSAAIEGPTQKGNAMQYEFRKAVGTKGAQSPLLHQYPIDPHLKPRCHTELMRRAIYWQSAAETITRDLLSEPPIVTGSDEIHFQRKLMRAHRIVTLCFYGLFVARVDQDRSAPHKALPRHLYS